MITVSKEILMHPDFIENLADELCEILEELMDEAFENDEIDFDFIDECADAINAIRSGNTAQILPVISRKEFFEKINIKTDNKFRKVAIAAAVAALILFAGTQIKTQENVSVIQSLSGIISEVFRSEQITETTTVFTEETTTESETTIKKKETTTADITKEIAGVDGISVETTPDFRMEYYVGEKFSSKGLKIFAEYENGERKLVPQKDYLISFCLI
ncbi:MAG: hypothetical protein E7555_08520 [Ruminococcaceae bacterium]|nr:hypothetical protein [Oscillospiraceae bacterium]